VVSGKVVELVLLKGTNHILCFVERASLHNRVNKAKLVYIFYYVYFLVYFSISTCFGGLCAHHQEKQLYLCDTYYLLFCMDDWYVEWNGMEFYSTLYP